MKREHELGQTAEARKRTDRDLRCIGWGLVLLGVLMPALVTVENTGIYRTLMNGIYQGQEIYVLLAALKLVVLNAVRAYPHYMGVFFLVETFRGMELRRRLLASIAAVGILIPGVYLLSVSPFALDERVQSPKEFRKCTDSFFVSNMFHKSIAISQSIVSH